MVLIRTLSFSVISLEISHLVVLLELHLCALSIHLTLPELGKLLNTFKLYQHINIKINDQEVTNNLKLDYMHLILFRYFLSFSSKYECLVKKE